MPYSNCGTEIQPPQLGEDFLPAMYLYHDVIICNNFIMVVYSHNHLSPKIQLEDKGQGLLDPFCS